ncbi:hypothetical protein DHD80_17685 [Gramella sp. AN32]|nr:hypothetical protein [Gramella sp. AN32]
MRDFVKPTTKGFHLKEETQIIPDGIAQHMQGIGLDLENYKQLKESLNLIKSVYKKINFTIFNTIIVSR